MKDAIKNVTIILLVIVLGIMFIISRTATNQRAEMAQTLNQERTEFNREVNELEDSISVQHQTILSQEEAIRAGLLKQEQLEKNNMETMQAYLEVKERATNLEEIIAEFEPDTIVIEKDNGYWLRLPALFSYEDDWLSLAGQVQRAGVFFYPRGINIISQPTFTIGERNKYDSRFMNFFSRPEPVVIYENKNPYFVTGEMENVIIEDDPPFYLRKEVWGIAGFVLGFIGASR